MKKPIAPALPMPMTSVELVESDLPTEETMAALNLTPAQFPDFIKALKATLLQSQGMTIGESCEQVGIARRSFYEARWQLLFDKAQRLITGKMMVGVQNARNYVLEAWPAIVRRTVAIAQKAQEDKDSIAATALLHQMFPELSQQLSADESAEVAYLKSRPNFNPLQPMIAIQAQAGSTVHIGDSGEVDVVDSES